MKRVITGLIGGIFALMLSACGENTSKQPESGTAPADQTQTTTPTGTGDQGSMPNTMPAGGEGSSTSQ